MTEQPPVLIIGAGLAGLTLAQSLKKRGVPCKVFERDESETQRSAGWGITLHWALPAFETLVPKQVTDRLVEAAVNPVSEAAGDPGSFPFFNLQTGQPLWSIPPTNRRQRLRRQHLRQILLDGVDVQWSKILSDFALTSDGNMAATFTDGSASTGSILVGCDGANSNVRQLLLPETHSSTQLPIRFMGVTVNMTATQIQPVLALDPLYFQGGDPSQDVFIFFSVLDSPGGYKADGTLRTEGDGYRCQIMVGWPARAPYPTELPDKPAERIALMKGVAKTWAPAFRDLFAAIPEDRGLEPREIRIHDWVPPQYKNVQTGPENQSIAVDKERRPQGKGDVNGEYSDRVWDNLDGGVTLLGDAAHPMTMFRGEAFNHGVKDVEILVSQIEKLYHLPAVNGNGENGVIVDSGSGSGSAAISDTEGRGNEQRQRRKQAVDAYEREMCARTHPAVLLSRQACLDAHDQKRINGSSPLVAKRDPNARLPGESDGVGGRG